MAANSIVNLPAFAEPEASSTSTTFQINCTKLYEHLRQGLKRTIPWNKYRFEKTIQPKIGNLDYIIHPKFRYNNRLFFILFNVNVNDNDNFPKTNIFDKCYMPLVEI